MNTEASAQKTIGIFTIMLATIYPLGVILTELFTNMCAQSFFDPIPTPWHAFLLLLVPLSNVLLCYQMNTRKLNQHVDRLKLLAGLSLGISAFYMVLFIPLIPLSLFAIVFMGLGLLPLGPIVAFIMAAILSRKFNKAIPDSQQRHSILKGFVLAMVILVVLDIPSFINNLGVQWARQDDRSTHDQGIQLLRTLGSEELLLRACYANALTVGPLNIVASLVHDDVSLSEAREIFYQVTGDPFNARPRPKIQPSGFRRFDQDQGGDVVASRAPNLQLLSSRIDGVVHSDAGVAYLEWTFELQNNDKRMHEARLQLSLPGNAVVSRATLWVNNEAREAAFAGKNAVRAAYQKIVSARRDPLLVTSNGGDRVMAQAFPIPANGGVMKFRLGITIPMQLISLDQVALYLPTIVARNFEIDNALTHHLWIEADNSVVSDLNTPLTVEKREKSNHRIKGALSHEMLSQGKGHIVIHRHPQQKPIQASLLSDTRILQTVTVSDEVIDTPLIILIDGSSHMAPVKQAIVQSLAHIQSKRLVGVFIAADHDVRVAMAPWSAQQRETAIKAIKGVEFIGGQDNTPALVQAIQALESHKDASILWIHAAQPVDFARSRTSLRQTIDRIRQIPSIKLYAVEPGENHIIDGSRLAIWSKNIPRRHSLELDLRDYFAQESLTQTRYRFKRERMTDHRKDPIAGSDHIARLWAHEEVYRLLKQDHAKNRQAATLLAAQYQLVTPVSGAVVLENKQQYKDNALSPVDANSVPTIAEPHHVLLMIIVLLIFLLDSQYHRRKKTVLFKKT